MLPNWAIASDASILHQSFNARAACPGDIPLKTPRENLNPGTAKVNIILKTTTFECNLLSDLLPAGA
jgi:hypothetical protein